MATCPLPRVMRVSASASSSSMGDGLLAGAFIRLLSHDKPNKIAQPSHFTCGGLSFAHVHRNRTVYAHGEYKWRKFKMKEQSVNYI